MVPVRVYLDYPSTASISVWARLDDSADAKKILNALQPENWKTPPGCTWITRMKTVLNDLESHDFTLSSSQYGSESPAVEVAGCEWRYALLVVQARNDDDKHKVTFMCFFM